MWILHPQFGFLSIVHKPHLPAHMLCVRSRSKEHLQAFRDFAAQHGETGPIQEDAGTDYAFRVVARRDLVVHAMASAVEGIDYSNFKNECKSRGLSSRWLQALGAIWREHFNFQRDTA